MTQLIDDLKAAREIVANRWCSKGLTTNGQDACIVGALNKAIAGNVYWEFKDECESSRRADAMDVLRLHLPEDFRQLHAYNDADTTTHQDAVNLFDKTLADLGAMA